MSYYYSYCYCWECNKINLDDKNPYNKNEDYCMAYRKYVDPNSHACSRYFEYNEKLKNNGCYITTAICNILGMDDNNIYLNSLRSFRDNVLAKDDNLKMILAQYDIVGPMVSYNLNNDPFRRTKSLMLFELYIKPIVKLLANKQYTEAILKYEQMTNELIDSYAIKKKDINMNELDLNDIGKGHKIKIKEN